MDQHNFIFHDRLGSRWRRVKIVLVLALITLIGSGSMFLHELLVLPQLAKLRAGISHIEQGRPVDISALPPILPPPSWLRGKSPAPVREARLPRVHKHEHIVLGFYAVDDERSLRAFSKHGQNLTHVAPDILSLSGFNGTVRVKPAEKLIEAADREGVKLLPVLVNYADEQWQPESVEHLARTPSARPAFFSNLMLALDDLGACGVVIDWQQVDPAVGEEMTELLHDLSHILRERGLELWLNIPVGNDIKVFDLDALAPFVDRFVATLFYENGDEDPPGPIASQEWWQEWWRVLLEHGQSEQWVPALGSFGYDWPVEGRAEMLGFADVMARAGLAEKLSISSVRPLLEPNFTYLQNGSTHVVWFLDAITFRNQMKRALDNGAGGVAVFRLGLEDPSIWNVLSGNAASETLTVVDVEDMIGHVGAGDMLTPVRGRTLGKRSVIEQADGLWQEIYHSYPAPEFFVHSGEALAGRVALTFDDGPDGEFTPQVLDILGRYQVQAAFFVVGSKAIEQPELLRRIVSEGHELGNHTYWHPKLSETPAGWATMELNATRSVIESATGMSTILFRPPYDADRFPLAGEQFRAIELAREAGYLTVNSSIDTEDWNGPSAEEVVERVKARRAEGNIVLLHDGGGDRSATVKALPKIIEWLKLRGDRIVSLEELLNVPRRELMPTLSPLSPEAEHSVVQAGLQTIAQTEDLVWLFLTTVTLMLLLRSGLIVALVLLRRRQEAPTGFTGGPPPPVSVIIAAYNEERIIGATLETLLRSDYPTELEVIVVDDGSTDATAGVVRSFQKRFGNLVLIHQQNSGKAVALNRGIERASAEHIVTLDADTQFEPGTVRSLIRALDRPNVGAVSGRVRVLNESSSLIARLQSLEYIAGFNLERRAYDLWNCITVVPGAAAAFRRSALVALGGFSADTVAEDTDVTLALHRHAFEVRYAGEAVAWTEAPDTVSGFLRQRARWAFGTLQCLWKHRQMLFHPRYRALAYFSLPSVWFCHFLLVIVSPALDLMLLGSLFWGFNSVLAAYAGAFLLSDFALAITACGLSGESWTKSLLTVPARLLYRPLLAFAVWKSVLRALRGAWVGWGKVERRGVASIEAFAAQGETGVI